MCKYFMHYFQSQTIDVQKKNNSDHQLPLTKSAHTQYSDCDIYDKVLN
jgi:hypothetical protein